MKLARVLLSATLLLPLAAPSMAQQAPCGGDFSGWIAGVRAEAVRAGHDAGTVDAFFASARQDARVLKADRSQGVFRKTFLDFSRSLISDSRMKNGKAAAGRYAPVFQRMQADYGISPGLISAFWAFETDFGQVQGDFNTLNALVTLAHDCRRPDLFRPQLLAALTLYESGDFEPAIELEMHDAAVGDALELLVDESRRRAQAPEVRLGDLVVRGRHVERVGEELHHLEDPHGVHHALLHQAVVVRNHNARAHVEELLLDVRPHLREDLFFRPNRHGLLHSVM